MARAFSSKHDRGGGRESGPAFMGHGTYDRPTSSDAPVNTGSQSGVAERARVRERERRIREGVGSNFDVTNKLLDLSAGPTEQSLARERAIRMTGQAPGARLDQTQAGRLNRARENLDSGLLQQILSSLGLNRTYNNPVIADDAVTQQYTASLNPLAAISKVLGLAGAGLPSLGLTVADQVFGEDSPSIDLGTYEANLDPVSSMPMRRRPNDSSRDPIQQIIADISGTAGLPTTDQPDLHTLRQGFNRQIDEAFPGDAFTSIDDNIIDSILDERQFGTSGASEGISRMQARGNFNPMGARTANEFLQGQRPEVAQELRDVGSGILTKNRDDLRNIRASAQKAADDWRIGDDLFDVTPFAQQREDLITERTGSLRDEVSDATSSMPLFNTLGAIQAGSKAQGLVSGPTQAGFLDTMAQRGRYGSNPTTDRRTGNIGSGVF